MDPALKEAATKGDVNFLKEAARRGDVDFLSRSSMSADKERGGNILHLAAWHNQVEFFKEAAALLPTDIQKQLLSQTDDDEYRWTPLHAAAVSNASHSIVKLIRQMYASFVDDDNIVEEALLKPLLELTDKNMTPLHLSLENENAKNEECAMELLSMDSEFVSCTIIDQSGNTPLCYALKNRFNDVAEMILSSTLSSESIFSSNDVLGPFSYANNCSENVRRLLFKKYGDWFEKTDSRSNSMLHRWAEKGEAWQCKLLSDLLLEEGDVGDVRTKIFKDCIMKVNDGMTDTPLHIAGRVRDSELGQILVRGYQQLVKASEGKIHESVAVESAPWRIENKNGNTPLHSAMACESETIHEEFVLEILSIDPSSYKICNIAGESVFYFAVMYGCARVVDKILSIEEPRYDMLCRNNGDTVLHNLIYCTEEIGKKLLNRYWWLINLRDNRRHTALECAKHKNVPWLVKLLSNPSLIDKQHFDWIEAYKRDEIPAVLAFVDSCQDLQKACHEQNDTPLHHIKLSNYKDYLDFLKIPSIAEVKNMTDRDGRTALHRALERKEKLLVKTLLLDDGVERTIADNNGTTAMELLAQLCMENEDWEKMCEIIKVNPYLKTSYIHSTTNLEQMRSTLSIVAALLATITFAAGFTLPGGFNSSNGEAVLARKASFTVFLLADVYAFCTSMLVLFCLIWSMVSVPDVARLLVDRSVRVLVTSLFATLIAFMCGIYAVINHSLLWAAIVTIVMCSITGFLAIRSILLWVAKKLIPSANRKKKDPKVVSVVQPQVTVYQEREMMVV